VVRGITLLVALVALFCWTIGNLAYAQQDFAAVRLVNEDVRIPVSSGNYTLAAKILRPEGLGPYGAIVLNHGAAVSSEERRTESPDLLVQAATQFARRGYVVVMPLRRGFGATGGEFAEDAGSCRNPEYQRGEAAAAEDVMAAYEYTRALPYVDGERMILAGQSAGGVASLYTAARGPSGLVAVLAFAAGRGGNPARNPGVPCAVEPLARVFDEMGKAVKVPVLFHYAENDHFFNAQTSRLWFERFTAAGARAEYVLQPAFGKDGHYIFSDDSGARYWLPAVERFLAKNGVPFEAMVPSEAAKKPMLAGQTAQ
jgi:dienelactone hydrolase